jgi:hypothetical protein
MLTQQEALMNDSPAAAVVVGIDASENSRAALKWAADEARMRGAVPRVGHSWSMQHYHLSDACGLSGCCGTCLSRVRTAAAGCSRPGMPSSNESAGRLVLRAR